MADTPSAGAQVFRRRNADREEARGRLGTPTSGRHRAGARNRRLITLRPADVSCAPSHHPGSSDRSAPAEYPSRTPALDHAPDEDPQPGFLILTVAGRAQLTAARRRGRLGTPASGRHSPPKAGGGRDSPFRGGPFSAGVSASGGICTWEWQTPYVTVRATCLHSVKADGKEPPAALEVVQSSPNGKNPHDRVLRTPRQEESGRHSRWPGAASSSLVSRSRACRPEAGPVLPVGAPSRPRHCAVGSTRSRAHPRCRRPAAAAIHGNRREVGVPYPTPRHGDQRPRFTRNRRPRHQVAPPWGALRAVSMRNTG